MKFETFPKARNKLYCNLGDCVVDKDYEDGNKHRWFLEKGAIHFEEKYTPKKILDNVDTIFHEKNTYLEYACTIYNSVYPTQL